MQFCLYSYHKPHKITDGFAQNKKKQTPSGIEKKSNTPTHCRTNSKFNCLKLKSEHTLRLFFHTAAHIYFINQHAHCAQCLEYNPLMKEGFMHAKQS